MAGRRAYVERDRRGRERIVVTPERSSTRELLNAAEERERELTSENESLRTRNSFLQSQLWEHQREHQRLRVQHQALVDEHYQCRHFRGQLNAQVNAVKDLEDKLEAEEHRTRRLEQRVRMLQRGSSDQSLRARFEEALAEAETLRERLLTTNASLRNVSALLQEKDRVILYLKGYLARLGYRVEG